MGARITLCDPHRAIVNGPSRLHGERAREPRHPRRHGDADRRARAEGTSEIGNIAPDRPRLRADRRTPARPRRPDRARRHRARPGLGLTPAGDNDEPATTDRHPGRTRRGDARAARDRVGAARAVRARGYAEVATPTIEYLDAFAQGAGPEGTAAYRFLDESDGARAPQRHDRADRPAGRPPLRRRAGPFRLAYSGSVYRRVRPQRGQLREFRQIGVELVGVEAPAGTAELIEVLVAALDAVGLETRGDRPRRRRPVPPAARRVRVEGGRPRRGSSTASQPTTSSRSRPRPATSPTSARRARPDRRAQRPPRRPRGARAGARRSAARRSSGRRPASPTPSRRSRPPGSPIASRSTSACFATSATTRARSSRSTTRPSATRSAAAVATTSCSAGSAARCPRRASRSSSSACTWPRRPRQARPGATVSAARQVAPTAAR